MNSDTVRRNLDIYQGTDALWSQHTHIQSHYREGSSTQQINMLRFCCLRHVFFCHELVCLIRDNKEARTLLAVLARQKEGENSVVKSPLQGPGALNVRLLLSCL